MVGRVRREEERKKLKVRKYEIDEREKDEEDESVDASNALQREGRGWTYSQW